MPVKLPAPAWRFVPESLDPGSLPTIEPLFADLAARPLTAADALERWLVDESELLARIHAEVARRYVRMTCHTDDDDAKKAYLHMEQVVMPRVKVLADQLDRKFLACAALGDLDQRRYEVLIRSRRTKSEIFREENTELQRQEAELQTQQQALMGAITVEFEGETRTLQQLAPFFESQDRALRERAFRAALQARQQRWPELEEIYDQLIALRTAIGRNAGFTTYTPYRFRELGRYDYSEADCRQFHDAIAQCVVPAVRELDKLRAERLGLDRLRPWDLEVDPEGRPPLRPFETQDELIGLCRRVFAAVDPRFADEFDVLVERDLLDLMSRRGKAPGGYQYQLEDERVPFIFANSVGLHHDVQTLLHEGGHAFHSLLCRDFDLLAYRDYPIEIAETASMSMELLGLEHLGDVYAADDAARAYKKHLEGVLRTLTWIASIDAIQHWVYGNPKHGRDDRRTAWLDIRRRFGGDIDWSGLEPALQMQWINQGHLFGSPFYYIEYGIAQLGALQTWRNYRKDPTKAVTAYRRALALGGSRPLPELFAAGDMRFDLSPKMLGKLVDDVMAQIRR
ncbi:MAG: M3 family oligoendopeptidase [Planctomycetes bacterium]|nr:M3 family oligoendopeptidase [Planctomycetota bacterium]MCB9886551.1 M3 family oligoendopeptidase [Planctomycetota bacterium]